MKLLLDTNIFIPLEPASTADVATNSEAAALINRRAQEGGHTTYLHPAHSHDIDRDKDTSRAELRRVLAGKYPELPDPPPITPAHESVIGSPARGSNDWVDNNLIVALDADAIDFLISEDRGIRKKARRLGIDHRVLTIDEAVRLLGAPASIAAPPAVRSIKPHALDKRDPIFDSFRADYPTFDDWFARCCRDHRQTWTIDGGDRLAGICIVKENDVHPGLPLGDRPLKICSFKVAEQFNGLKYGELLLKTVFEHAHGKRATGMFVTVFEKHQTLLELLDDFGFSPHAETTDVGELILTKLLEPQAGISGLDYHIKYGPPRFDAQQDWHLVPIQPRFSDALFPETCATRNLFEGQLSFGNAIRKAYLCHAPSRQLVPGSVLAFYRTQRRQGLIAIGVVEDTTVTRDPAVVVRAVARRTVYSAQEIQDLCEAREVLAIRFRQVRVVAPCKTPEELMNARVFARAPQSIMCVGGEGTQWLIDQFSA